MTSICSYYPTLIVLSACLVSIVFFIFNLFLWIAMTKWPSMMLSGPLVITSICSYYPTSIVLSACLVRIFSIFNLFSWSVMIKWSSMMLNGLQVLTSMCSSYPTLIRTLCMLSEYFVSVFTLFLWYAVSSLSETKITKDENYWYPSL